MLKVSQLERINVFKPKKNATGDPRKMGARQLSVVGKVHLTVFDPKGTHVAGFLVKKPDVASMIKVPDAFLALDSFAVCDLGLVATRGDESFDDAARERLGLDWDRCIIWAGMDAKTTNGKSLGWVSDVEFDAKTGKAKTFFIGDGVMSSALVGNVEVPADMLRGYRDGFMLVDPKAAGLSLDGGAAARAGEAYGRAKYEGSRAARKAAASAGRAVERGAFGLGKMIGDTKRAFQEASADTRPAPQEVKSISEPVASEALPGEVGEPQEYVPAGVEEAEAAASGGEAEEASAVGSGAPQPDDGAAQDKVSSPKRPPAKRANGKPSGGKSASNPKKSAGDATARAIGRQLGRTKGMFGAFLDEYKKASK